jgi:hypothetical protein
METFITVFFVRKSGKSSFSESPALIFRDTKENFSGRVRN